MKIALPSLLAAFCLTAAILPLLAQDAAKPAEAASRRLEFD
jgi:hypothetical protein